jgi:protein O-GlcNAc transferase
VWGVPSDCHSHVCDLSPYFVFQISMLFPIAQAYGVIGLDHQRVSVYERAVALEPTSAAARLGLGRSLRRVEKHAEAVTHLSRARELATSASDVRNATQQEAAALNALGEHTRALAVLDGCDTRGEVLPPSWHVERGNALLEMEQWEEAEQEYMRALEQDEGYVTAMRNLAALHIRTKTWGQALGFLERVLERLPDDAEITGLLGHTHRHLKNRADALRWYKRAVQLDRSYTHLNGLGLAHWEAGELAASKEILVEATQMEPTKADAWNNLGSTLLDMRALTAAGDAFREALRHNVTADPATTHYNLGNVYFEQQSYADAITQYRAAVNLKPDFPNAYGSLVYSLLFTCVWDERDDMLRRITQFVQTAVDEQTAPPAQPMQAILYGLSPVQQREVAATYASHYLREVQSLQLAPLPRAAWPTEGVWPDGSGPDIVEHAGKKHILVRDSADEPSIPPLPPAPASPTERIRIAYLSSDFRAHAIGRLTQRVYGLHDRTRFEVHCYAIFDGDGSETAEQIERECDAYTRVKAMTDAQVAEHMSSAGIHVLVDVNSYTRGQRMKILAMRPAPVAVSFLGFPGTSGARDYIDYIVVDRTIASLERAHYFTENLVSMPHTYQSNSLSYLYPDIPHGLTDPPTRTSLGLPEDKFIYVNFNQLYKITPEVFDVWMRVLHRVPDSVLWLVLNPSEGVSALRKEAEARGVDSTRLIFAEKVPLRDHVIRASIGGDLFLDTYVYNGHTTATDVLWAGLPVLTRPGEQMASRVAAGLLTALGREDLVVESWEAYEEMAVRAADNGGGKWPASGGGIFSSGVTQPRCSIHRGG